MEVGEARDGQTSAPVLEAWVNDVIGWRLSQWLGEKRCVCVCVLRLIELRLVLLLGNKLIIEKRRR